MGAAMCHFPATKMSIQFAMPMAVGNGVSLVIAGSGAVAMVVDRFRSQDFKPKYPVTTKVLTRPFELVHAA